MERFKNKVLISEGNFSSSFLAYDEKLGRNVFIKVFPKENRGMAEGEFMFLSKVRYKTPHVYELLSNEDGEKFVLVEEFISGKNLRDIMDEVGKLPLPVALFIAEEVLRFLNFINSMGLYHGDISAENIIISFDGTVYVVDPAPFPDIATPEYFPEHTTEKNIKVDMFAVSVLMCEMILGLPPEEIKKKVLDGEGGKKLSLLSDLPEKLRTSIQNALYMKYLSPSEFLRDLIEFSTEERLSVFEGELSRFLREKEFKWEYKRKEREKTFIGRKTLRFFALLVSLIAIASSLTLYVLSGMEEKKQGEIAYYSESKKGEIEREKSKDERRKLHLREEKKTGEEKKKNMGVEKTKKEEDKKDREIEEKESVATRNNLRRTRKKAVQKTTTRKQKVQQTKKTIVDNTGLLSLNSFPFSKVFINGKFVDYTPITRMRIGAGRYKVELISEDGKRKTFSLQIEKGKEVKIFVNLLSGRIEKAYK